MKITKYFSLEEFVPKDVYDKYQGKSSWFIDHNLLIVAEALRAKFGPITINNWKWGGDRQFSGFRPPECNIGAKYSQHRFGRAIDMIFKDATAEEVREYIKKNNATFRQFISAVEDDVDWVHIDSRFRNPKEKGVKKIMFFKP